MDREERAKLTKALKEAEKRINKKVFDRMRIMAKDRRLEEQQFNSIKKEYEDQKDKSI